MTCHRDFLVDRQDLNRTHWRETELRPSDGLNPGEIWLAHRRFAFTANNITYARCGDLFDYWRYFPAPLPFGSIPVWGVGQVIASRCDEIAEGENIYGYFPMSTHVVLQPERMKTTGFVDASPHRAALPRTYNEYGRLDRDPGYDKTTADAHLVLRPLFSLSFFLAHFLNDANFFGAGHVIISSASSKAAMGLAFQLRRLSTIRSTALTGAANLGFVARSGLYDRVLSYEEIASLPGLGAAVYIDIAGNDGLRADIHRLLGDHLLHSCCAGLTHEFPDLTPGKELPGPAPQFFFTPQHILERRALWGTDDLRRRLSIEWQAFVSEAANWLAFEHSHGRTAIEEVYRNILHGRRAPDRADILNFEPD